MLSISQSLLLGIAAAAVAVAAYATKQMLVAKRSGMKSFARMIGALGHDLRSPLQTIQSATSLLAEALSHQEKEQFSAAAKSSVELISVHIEDMVRIARGQNLAYAPAATDMEAWWSHIEATYQPKAISKGLKWESQFKTTDDALHVDSARLTQCVGYLLDNAIRYTTEGKVSLAFEYGPQQTTNGSTDAGAIRVSVVDTGPGIADKDVARLSAPFDIAIAGKSEKLSRGLAMAVRIARAAAGSLTVRSKAGAGTAFTLLLPATRAVLPSSVASVASTPSLPSPSATGAEVLIVDGPRQQLSQFAALLTDAGFSVEMASTEADGLNRIAEANFGVVVSDLSSDVVNGYTLADKRKRPNERPFFIAVDSKSKPFGNGGRMPMFGAVLDLSVSAEEFLDAIEDGLSSKEAQAKANA